MKTKTFLFLGLLLLASCNSDSGGSKGVSYTVPVGTINKQWIRTNDLSRGSSRIESIDLSDPNNIEVKGLLKVTKAPEINGAPESAPIVTSSDCVYSSAAPVLVTDLSGYYETTLVSGAPEVCKQLVPKMYFRHYGSNQNSDEFLNIGANLLE